MVMAKDSVDTETGGSDETPAGNDSKDTSTLSAEEQRAIKRRDAALKKARELEARASEMERKLAERDAEEQERQAELERQKGEWSKVAERKDKKIEQLASRVAEFEQKEAAALKAKRRDAYVDAIAEATGVKNKARLRGLLREAADAYGVDTSPEEVTEDLISDGVDILKRLDEETFAPKQSKPTPVAGQGVKSTTPGKIDYYKVAAAGGIDAYNKKLREEGG